jgi:hypothetical protein
MIAYHTHAGRLGCAERIDIGEHIYRVPLIDDVTGDGMLDLVVGTLNGQVRPSPSSPLTVHCAMAQPQRVTSRVPSFRCPPS